MDNCLVAGDGRAALFDVPLCLRGEEFGVLEDPQVDQLSKIIGVGFFNLFEMIATEHLPVTHGALGSQVEDMSFGERADCHFQSAELAVPPSGLVNSDIVAADGRAPAGLSIDGFELEAGKMVWQLTQAMFDFLRQAQAVF